MDNTANEVDSVDVKSYPTLIFYPSNKKKKGITYEDGSRTVDSFVPWIKAHSTKVTNWDNFGVALDDDEEVKADL